MIRLAFLFPGQGSQYVGMGRALSERFPRARAAFEEADAALGEPLSRLIFEGPEETLRLTANAQPAILAASVALYRVLEEAGLRPDLAAGHSLGEYSALVAAGALRYEDAVRAVRARGRFMQEAVPPGVGAMAAVVRLAPKAVEAACARAAQGEVCSPANFNGPDQTVIAGHSGAVERAAALLLDAGARKVVTLPVSAPFHCALMAPVQPRLREVLEAIPKGRFAFPVVGNVEARPSRDPDRVTDLLVRQVTAPVRWAESVAAMRAGGPVRFVEVGPGRVLAGLLRQLDRAIEVVSSDDPVGLEALLSGSERAVHG